MRPSTIGCSVLIAVTLLANAQTAELKIYGVSEPPELTGEPKKISEPTPADKGLFEIVEHLTDPNETRNMLPTLSKFIEEHPDYSDAYYLRATSEACILNSHDWVTIAADVEGAKSHLGAKIYNETDYYSLLGKIALAKAEYRQAVDDLERAMSRDLDSAQNMFSIDGIEPEQSSKFCIWNLTDLDGLVSKFPMDYRPRLFRGLYYDFFTTYKEDVYPRALEDFRKSALLNPKSALPVYFIGQVHNKESFWTQKAWASDAERDTDIRNAVREYTKAILLDPAFLPAYKERASGYLNLKQYPQAIKDYDKVLVLDPENIVAYSDRGLAKLDSGQYLSAKIDLSEAIRRDNEGDSYLWNLYTNRGDANVKLGYFAEAIADYSKAIERRLANDTFLLSLQQMRALYPEYDGVPDATFCRKLNLLFFPQIEYTVFAKRLMEKNGQWRVSLLNDLYEKRGDAYLRSGDYRRGALDFTRIFKGMPNYADSTNRWRTLGKTSVGEEIYLDVKTFESPTSGTVLLWTKTAGKKETQTTAYQIDCKAKRIERTSSITYDKEGKVMSSSELVEGWQQIVPDTIGEQLYVGACSASP